MGPCPSDVASGHLIHYFTELPMDFCDGVKLSGLVVVVLWEEPCGALRASGGNTNDGRLGEWKEPYGAPSAHASSSARLPGSFCTCLNVYAGEPNSRSHTCANICPTV